MQIRSRRDLVNQWNAIGFEKRKCSLTFLLQNQTWKLWWILFEPLYRQFKVEFFMAVYILKENFYNPPEKNSTLPSSDQNLFHFGALGKYA